MSLDEDRRTINAIVLAIYEMLSGPAGLRDYDRVKGFYHPDARLIRTGVDDNGAPFTQVMTVDEHHADVDRKLADLAFLEEEIAHDCEVFGNIARVRSIYRSVYGTGESAQEGRGVNFFHLIRYNSAWTIVSVIWDNERRGLSIDDLA